MKEQRHRAGQPLGAVGVPSEVSIWEWQYCVCRHRRALRIASVPIVSGLRGAERAQPGG